MRDRLGSSAAISVLIHALAGAAAVALTSAAYLRLNGHADAAAGSVRVGAIQEIDVKWGRSATEPARARTMVTRAPETAPNPADASGASATGARASRSGGSSAASAAGAHPGVTSAAAAAKADAPSTDGDSAALAPYLAQVRAGIASRLRYPVSLRRRRVEGVVELALTLDPAGRLDSARVARSSGNAELDELALEAARAAAPFAAPSEELKKKGRLELSLPIEFRID